MSTAAEGFSGIPDYLPGCSGPLREPDVGKGGTVTYSTVSVGCVEVFVASHDCSIREDSWKAERMCADIVGSFYSLALPILINLVLFKIG